MENNGMITLNKSVGGEIDIRVEDIVVIEDVVFKNPSENWTKIMITGGYSWSIEENRIEIKELMNNIF